MVTIQLTVLLELTLEGAAIDPEDYRCLGAVAAHFGERLDD